MLSGPCHLPTAPSALPAQINKAPSRCRNPFANVARPLLPASRNRITSPMTMTISQSILPHFMRLIMLCSFLSRQCRTVSEFECATLFEHMIDHHAAIIEVPPADFVLFNRNAVLINPCPEFGIGCEFGINELLAALAYQQFGINSAFEPGSEFFRIV